jgi:3-oxoacyl-[acyl-carrier protein] reductase
VNAGQSARQVAIVTGAGGGIGRAIVTRLAGDGFAVVAGDIDPSSLGDLADDPALSGRAVRTVTLDVTQPSSTDAAVAAALDTFGGLDVVVNNAGVARGGPIHRITDADWNLVFDVSARGSFNMCRSAAGQLRTPAADGRHRKVVNMASVNGVYGAALNGTYAAAKAAVIGLTKSLAREWAPRRINVNAIAPGLIAGTGMTTPDADASKGLPSQEVLDAAVARIPIGRAGQPADIASLVSFLASPQSNYITGQVIEVHGGMEQMY